MNVEKRYLDQQYVIPEINQIQSFGDRGPTHCPFCHRPMGNPNCKHEMSFGTVEGPDKVGVGTQELVLECPGCNFYYSESVGPEEVGYQDTLLFWSLGMHEAHEDDEGDGESGLDGVEPTTSIDGVVDAGRATTDKPATATDAENPLPSQSIDHQGH